VELFEDLHQSHPGVFDRLLARSLTGLGARLGDLQRQEEAAAALQKAVRLYRGLELGRPGALRPELASRLHDLGALLGDLDRFDEALAATAEAVELRRVLSSEQPETCGPDLAASLRQLSDHLRRCGRSTAALAASDEALRLLTPFFVRHPADFQSPRHACVVSYLAAAGEAGVEVDPELPAPIAESLGAGGRRAERAVKGKSFSSRPHVYCRSSSSGSRPSL